MNRVNNQNLTIACISFLIIGIWIPRSWAVNTIFFLWSNNCVCVDTLLQFLLNSVGVVMSLQLLFICVVKLIWLLPLADCVDTRVCMNDWEMGCCSAAIYDASSSSKVRALLGLNFINMAQQGAAHTNSNTISTKPACTSKECRDAVTPPPRLMHVRSLKGCCYIMADSCTCTNAQQSKPWIAAVLPDSGFEDLIKCIKSPYSCIVTVVRSRAWSLNLPCHFAMTNAATTTQHDLFVALKNCR